MIKKVELLIDEPCPELLCGICSDVLEDPIQVHCPEDHMFCSKCIQNYEDTKCPICLTALDKNSFQLSKFVQRQVSRLRIKCAYSANGCQWQGLILDDHISNCEYQPCVCPNSEKGCKEPNLNNSNLQEHLKTCLYQTITCPNNMPLCQPFLLKDLSKHENECQSYTCPYASEGCPFIGTLSQSNVHCKQYCGRLHQKITQLEDEVKRLNKLIQDITLGLPTTPENAKDDKQQDISMTEMDLFHQMFNSTDPFNTLDLTNKPVNTASETPIPITNSPTNNHSNIELPNTTTTTTTTTTTMASSIPAIDNPNTLNDDQLASMMDLSNCLTDMSFLDNINNNNTSDTNSNDVTTTAATTNTTTNTNTNTTNATTTTTTTSSNSNTDFNSLLFDTATSPQPLEFIPPVHAPKRTSNGKKIRYSKNVRLAHNALRMARQRNTVNNSSSNIFNPTNDAILNNLDIAKQKKNQQLNFKNINDTRPVSKNESTSKPMVTKSITKFSTSKKEKKKSIEVAAAAAAAASSPPSTSAPKRRPMFILASSYLSNYNNNNEKSV